MYPMPVRFTILAFFFILPLMSQAIEEPPPFRAEVNLVSVAAVVRSTDGKLIRNLDKNDFQVAEDGSPQTIRFFAHETDLPLSLGFIVDASGSQDKFLKQHSNDIEAFLKTVLRPSDQAFAICFGNHLRLVSDTSSDWTHILGGLKRFQKGDRQFPEIGPKENRDLGTALYDAIYFSVAEKLQSAGDRRRALIVFSDGEENSSEHDLIDLLEAAQNANTLVYCIRYTETQHGRLTARNKYGTRVMKHIASLSGGADFDALASNLKDVFQEIGEELRSMYQVSYVSANSPTHDGTFRKVTLHCKQSGLIVRAKSGYYAR